MQKVALVNSTTDTLKKSRSRQRTDRAWFSRLVRHPARKKMEWVYSYNPGAHMGQRGRAQHIGWLRTPDRCLPRTIEE